MYIDMQIGHLVRLHRHYPKKLIALAVRPRWFRHSDEQLFGDFSGIFGKFNMRNRSKHLCITVCFLGCSFLSIKTLFMCFRIILVSRNVDLLGVWLACELLVGCRFLRLDLLFNVCFLKTEVEKCYQMWESLL